MSGIAVACLLLFFGVCGSVVGFVVGAVAMPFGPWAADVASRGALAAILTVIGCAMLAVAHASQRRKASAVPQDDPDVVLARPSFLGLGVGYAIGCVAAFVLAVFVREAYDDYYNGGERYWLYPSPRPLSLVEILVL